MQDFLYSLELNKFSGEGLFMTLKQLIYVLKVAEVGNMTEAASRLFIAQPSLTHAISELEKELGITIFIRTNRGITTTREGDEFLGYARNVIEQADLLEERYKRGHKGNPRFAVSCQHYSFAVSAFVEVINLFPAEEYDFILRETETYEIIEDVSHLRSEVGVLYLSPHNQTVLEKVFRKNDLVFTELLRVAPHIFISNTHPLSDRETLSLEDLEPYPYLSYEQRSNNSFYFSEEPLNALECRKNIKVRDRATLFNLAVGLNGYTVSSGIIDSSLSGPNIISKPLDTDGEMRIGYIRKKNAPTTRYCSAYINFLKDKTGASQL